jgi:hypothetical protein
MMLENKRLIFWQRWGRLLKQQPLITVYRWLTMENKLPFSV